MVFSACASRKPAQAVFFKTDTVSIEKIVTYRDTVFVTEKSEVSATFKPDLISVEMPIKKENKNVTLTISKSKDGAISADCKCDSVKVAAKLKNSLEKIGHSQSVIKTETTIKEVKYTPLWAKILSAIGALFILLLLIEIYKKTKT